MNAVDYEGFFSNKVALYWVSGYDTVIIYLRNIGVDTLDYVRGTVKSDSGKKETFSKFYLKPFVTYTITVKLNMLKCKEKLTVTYYGQDGNNVSDKSTINGTREIQSELVQYWNKGTFSSKYKSINYHFKKHGKEVSSYNIGDYVGKSIDFRNEVVSDIKNFSKSKLKKKYKITKSSGKIPAKKYKSKVNGKYIILTNVGNKILSFGK